MQRLARGHAFDGLDLVALGLDRQHQAGTHQPAVQGDAASAAVAGDATLLGADQAERPAQHFTQAVGGIAKELAAAPVDGGGVVGLRLSSFSPAPSANRSSATFT